MRYFSYSRFIIKRLIKINTEDVLSRSYSYHTAINVPHKNILIITGLSRITVIFSVKG